MLLTAAGLNVQFQIPEHGESIFGRSSRRYFNGVRKSQRLLTTSDSATTSPNKKVMAVSHLQKRRAVCTLRARREGPVAKPGSSVVTEDDPVRKEQVL